MKVREAIRKLKRAGWQKLRKGATSHAIWIRGSEKLLLTEHGNDLDSAAIAMIRRATK